MHLDSFATFNIAILVLALGKWLTRRIAFLRNFNIPEPVTGGLIVCFFTALLFVLFRVGIGFDLAVRDFLLLYFFAAIGLNSDFKTLRAGGRPLAMLVGATVLFMLLQNFTGVGIAAALGLNHLVGLLGGSVSLLGGHGTSIAWAPTFAEEHGIPNAGEIGIACATVGLVLASVMGGPIARILITRNRLEPRNAESLDIGIGHGAKTGELDYFALLRTLFWLNVSLVIGGGLQDLLERAGVRLPLFVCCLFGAILLTNLLPRFTRLEWPAGSRSLALVSDLSLGIFLTMSLMSLQLWTIASLAGPILALLGAQFTLAFAYALFVILIGEEQHGATHAWAEVYLPGAGWIGFDPTNNKLAGSEHVTVAVARDHEKASPLSGSYAGSAEAFERMEVLVRVFRDSGP